ncbi:MAG TPA: hypothetical protein VHA52_10490 [Candidatus Babeliaceae bacterium]|nr:hypothetical protein [Candidatus Babeliaceae bacterium]
MIIEKQGVYLTVKSTAQVLNRKINTLYSWPSRYPDKIPRYRFDRKTYFLKTDVMKMRDIELAKLKPE